MNDIRLKFEEIWPVPEGISYANDACGYVPYEFSDRLVFVALEHNARLDTFTRCQESMGPVLSLVEEMVMELESCYFELRVRDPQYILVRAKELMEPKQ